MKLIQTETENILFDETNKTLWLLKCSNDKVESNVKNLITDSEKYGIKDSVLYFDRAREGEVKSAMNPIEEVPKKEYYKYLKYII